MHKQATIHRDTDGRMTGLTVPYDSEFLTDIYGDVRFLYLGDGRWCQDDRLIVDGSGPLTPEEITKAQQVLMADLVALASEFFAVKEETERR